MATIQSGEDYESLLIEILRSLGGRGSPGQVRREFERRFYSSIPRSAMVPDDRHNGQPLWQTLLDAARERLTSRRKLYVPDPDIWDLA